MIRDRGRHAKTIDRPAPRNRRREHLVALHMAVQARRDLAGRLVSRQGVSWVNVARCDAPRRTVDVACDYRSGGWRFCRLADGATITRAENVAECVEAIARELAKGEPVSHQPAYPSECGGRRDHGRGEVHGHQPVLTNSNASSRRVRLPI